jgi:MFS family permease
MVYASTAIVWASYALLAVALPFRFQALDLSVVQYGVAIAVLSLGMLLTESVWGVLAFRLAHPRMILLFGTLVAVIYLGIGISTSYLVLALLLGVFGALMIFQVPLMRWMALTARGPGTGGRGTGIYGLFSGGGLAVGTALGPLIYVAVGFTTLTFLVIGVYALGVGLTLVLPWSQVELPPRQVGYLRHLREVSTRPFLLVAGLVVLAFIAKALVLNFLQYYSVALFRGTPTDAGYVIGVALAASLVAGAVLGIVVDRWGAIRSAPFGFALISVGAAGTYGASSYAEMVGATVVLSIGIGWLGATLLPLALGPIALPLQGTAVGVVGSFEDLGLLLGPLLISGAYAVYGVRSIFLTVGAVGLAGVGLTLLLRPPNRAGRE